MGPTQTGKEDATPEAGLLAQTDRILRGALDGSAATGTEPVATSIAQLTKLGILLAAIYGASLGLYGVCHGGTAAGFQVLAATVKVPLLFFLTLIVTFPSLYVFSTLQRSPLRLRSTLRMLMVAIVVNAAVLASLGPVFAFFAASTKSYSFLLLLNVFFCAVAGVISLVVLRRAMKVSFQSTSADARVAVRRVLMVWCMVYGAVGAQMAWLLRPFLGAPGTAFELFRARQGSFYEAVLHSIRNLFGG